MGESQGQGQDGSDGWPARFSAPGMAAWRERTASDRLNRSNRSNTVPAVHLRPLVVTLRTRIIARMAAHVLACGRRGTVLWPWTAAAAAVAAAAVLVVVVVVAPT